MIQLSTFFKSLLSSVLSFLNGWQGYLLAGALAIGLGFYLGWTVEGWRMTSRLNASHLETSQLQSRYDQYKNLVLQEAVRTSEETVSKMQLAQDSIQSLTLRLQQSQSKQRQLSSALTESLKNVPSTLQNPLSSATITYLDKLRSYQTSDRTNTSN